MRAACWFLRERLVVAWASVGDGAEVGTVEVLAGVAEPSAAPSEVEREWTAVHEGVGKVETAIVLMEAGGLGAAWAWRPGSRSGGQETACECERGRLGPLTDWGVCPGCDCELVRCGGCGLVRCSANCGVGMRGAPEAADREVRAQLWRPDPSWGDTIML